MNDRHVLQVNTYTLFLVRYTGENADKVSVLLVYRLKDIVGVAIGENSAHLIVEKPAGEVSSLDVTNWREAICKWQLGMDGTQFE